MIKLLKSKQIRRFYAVLLVMAVLVGGTAVAYAITITIDGVRETAWDGGGSQSDPNEGTITNDGVDLQTVQWTNDTSKFYFLFQTYVDVTWDLTGFTDAELILCVNSDNDTSTGTNLPGQCIGSGYERYVRIIGPTPTASVFDSAGAPIAATTNVAFDGTIVEFSIDLVSLGLNSGNCGPMLVGVYFDGQTQDPDDNVLDTSDVPITCGSPTAVTLQNISAAGQSVVLPFALSGLVLIIVSIVLVINRKWKTVK